MEFTKETDKFQFGIEAEFSLVAKDSYKPLWYQDITFTKLHDIFTSIDLSDYPTLGLKLEPPHSRLMPYVVEGYHLPDAELNPIDLLPKGVEIRTPIANEVETCIGYLADLFWRLDARLKEQNLVAVAISHHPLATEFSGPQNKRRHDFWQWAQQAMMTYGPDFNVSLPRELRSTINSAVLDAKVNFYGPAMAALSLNSPFYGGRLWTRHETIGRAIRTYHRSVKAPAIELHPDQDDRLEFKLFEASPHWSEYEGYLLLWLALILDTDLNGRASAQDRVYDLGKIAVYGLDDDETRRRITEVLEAAELVLPKWGFRTKPLEDFWQRVDARKVPADRLIAAFQEGQSLEKCLEMVQVSNEISLAYDQNKPPVTDSTTYTHSVLG
jgi:carboxylate-amine ligase